VIQRRMPAASSRPSRRVRTWVTESGSAGPQTVTVGQDASPVLPRPVPLDATEPGRFGWHLVQELSQSVRADIHAADKTVTSVVPCPTGVISPH
jgi:hypothetical protein